MPEFKIEITTEIIDLITIIISITSLLFSLITSFIVFYKQRRNIHFKVIGSTFVDFLNESGNGQLCIEILLINKSQNPISVNYFELIDENNISYICHFNPSLVEHKFQHLIDTDNTYEKFIESATFPINLNSLGASKEYVYFHLPKNFKIKKCNIYTNRGNVIVNNDVVLSLSKCNYYHNGKRYDKRDYSH